MADEDLTFHLALFFDNLDLLLSRKNWGVSKILHLPRDLVCTGLQSGGFSSKSSEISCSHLDRHPCDVESKGKEAFFALEPLEADSKLALGDGEGVPQV